MSLFSVPKPQYISRTVETTASPLDAILLDGNVRLLQDLERKAATSLPKQGRPEKAVDVGFFGQGIITGGVVLLSTVAICTSLVCYYTVKYFRS